MFFGEPKLLIHILVLGTPRKGPECRWLKMVGQDYADLFRELRGDLVNKESEKATWSTAFCGIKKSTPQQKINVR